MCQNTQCITACPCHQDALWEKGKPAEAVWCFGKCSAEKIWVLPFMWMLLWHMTPTHTLLQTEYTPSQKQYYLIQQENVSQHEANWFRNDVFVLWLIVFVLWLLVFVLWLIVFVLWLIVFVLWLIIFVLWLIIFVMWFLNSWCSLMCSFCGF